MAANNLEEHLDALFSDLDDYIKSGRQPLLPGLPGGTTPAHPFSADPPPAAATPARPLTGGNQTELWLKNRRTIDPLLETAVDADPRTARIALETLRQIGQPVAAYVQTLALQPTSPLHPGAAAFISYLLGQPVVHIPLGPFWMGTDAAEDDMSEPGEQPRCQVALAGYWLGRYPVTFAQFEAFGRESGHTVAGLDFLPGYADHPAAGVNWFDALAYCRWLRERTGLPVALPSEAEWEKAARGADGRRYPWGNEPPTARRVNLHHATPVGQYSPQGDSPYGCADMAGNVWEWTRSTYQPYPYNPADGREELEVDMPRVLRGLTFNNPAPLTRSAYRYRLQAHLRLPMLGFRVAVCPV